MTEYDKLEFVVRALAGTLGNPSMQKMVDGEKSVVMSLTEATVWQEELEKIGQTLQSLKGGKSGQQ